MKRLLYVDNTIGFEVNVEFMLPGIAISATQVLPISLDEESVDPRALDNYHAFIDNLEEIVHFYGFELIHSHVSRTSYYYMYAHKDEIEADNVPKYIWFSVSDHVEQHKTPEHNAKIKKNIDNLMEQHKKPSTKIRQRYIMKQLTVNNVRFSSYEEALNAVEAEVRSWLEEKHIDLSQYGDPSDWTV